MIKINGKDYKLKDSFRNMIQFEEITGKRFPIELNLKDAITYFYSMLTAQNDDFLMTQDELIDAMDDDPQLFVKFNSFLNESRQVTNDVKKKEVK